MLSREEIADAALIMVDKRGIETLTMRALAAELGVGTMTLYGYFADKRELLDAAIGLGAERVEFSPPSGGSWQKRLRQLMQTVLASLIEHPSLVQLRREGPILNPAALRACETGLRILTEAGLSEKDAAWAWRLLFIYVFGYAAYGSPRGASPDVQKAWREELAALPPDEYALTIAVADDAAATLSGTEAFERGLDVIVAGLAARATPRPPTSS
jgi:AcrR family transcriptional regulator